MAELYRKCTVRGCGAQFEGGGDICPSCAQVRENERELQRQMFEKEQERIRRRHGEELRRKGFS